MALSNKQDFIACLDKYPERANFAVYNYSKRKLIEAVNEIGFYDYSGEDYAVMNRLRSALSKSSTNNVLWGMVCIDLWFCSGAGGEQWDLLISRENANILYLIEAAYFIDHFCGSNSGRYIADYVNRLRCWGVVGRHLPISTLDWWRSCVLPYKDERGA